MATPARVVAAVIAGPAPVAVVIAASVAAATASAAPVEDAGIMAQPVKSLRGRNIAARAELRGEAGNSAQDEGGQGCVQRKLLHGADLSGQW